MTQNRPDTDPASRGSLSALLRETLRGWLRDEVDDMLPCRVESYDDATNRATVQPLVMIGTTSKQRVRRAPIVNIPVLRLGGGGFFLRFPLKRGDLGWIKASDRDISLIMQRDGGEDWPNTKRLHSFSDGVLIPDVLRRSQTAPGAQEAVSLQSEDGSVAILLFDDRVEVRGPTVFKGDVDVEGAIRHQGVGIGREHRHGGVEGGNSTSGTVA